VSSGSRCLYDSDCCNALEFLARVENGDGNMCIYVCKHVDAPRIKLSKSDAASTNISDVTTDPGDITDSEGMAEPCLVDGLPGLGLRGKLIMEPIA